jgi:hypothetical protein
MPAVDLIRPYWLPGLHAVSGKVLHGLHEWFVNKDYQAYDPLVAVPETSRVDHFYLTVTESRPLVTSIACDCNRVSIACFESLSSITQIENIPRSTAWLLVKYYYAAFFAAHSILRMLGISCSYLDGDQPAAVNEIFSLFGSDKGLKITSGNYKCTFDAQTKKLLCIRSGNDKGGTHQFLWRCFYEEIKRLSDQILTGKGQTSAKQLLAAQLISLAENLCAAGNPGGGWLSFMRNRVNYKHHFGSWFPYAQSSKASADQLFEIRHLWQVSTEKLSLDFRSGGELNRFVRTCAFIISLCRELVLDMSSRHPSGRSFHRYGTMALLNLLAKTGSV